MILDEIWHQALAGTGIPEKRPDFRFDPIFYGHHYPDAAVPGDAADLARLRATGSDRAANSYRFIARSVADLDDRIAELITDPRLHAAIRDGVDGAHELAFELITLGAPIDHTVSDFSQPHYHLSYPDIEKAGLNAFHHYIQFGCKEGRRTLRDIRQNQVAGAQVFDPGKPTCMICVHEFSGTGAPIVGLEIATSAARSHNVIVLGLRGGKLLKAFQKVAVTVLITEAPGDDLQFFDLPGTGRPDFAILN